MRLKKRIAAMLMAGAMVCSALPVNVLAAEISNRDTDGLCEHHPQHTEECGYIEGTEGTPCAHEHDGDCYAFVTKCIHEHTEDCYPAQDVSGNTAADDTEDREPDGCSHECSEESGCMTKKLVCAHEENGHDEECGYTEGSEGASCTYVCKICKEQQDKEGDQSGEGAGTEADEQVGKVQEMIDRLPAKDALADMDSEGQKEVYDRVQEAYEAYGELSEEQKEAIDGAEIFEELFSYFSGLTEESAHYPSGDRIYMIGGWEFKPDTYYVVDPDDPSSIISNGASAENYQFYLDSGAGTLTLKNLKLDNYILIPGGITVELIGENVLTVSGATIQTLTEGDLIIGGSGSLKINGGGSEELCLTEPGNLTIKDSVTIELNGMESRGHAVSIQDGTLEITDDAFLTVSVGNVDGGKEAQIHGNAQVSIKNGELSGTKILIGENASVDVCAETGCAINGSGGLSITGNASVTAKGLTGGLNAFYGDLTIDSSKKVEASATGSRYAAISMGQGDPSPILNMTVSGEVAVSGSVGIGSSQGNIIIDDAALTIDADRIGITSKHEGADITIANGSTVKVTTTASPSNGIASGRDVIIQNSTVEVEGNDKYAFVKKPLCTYTGDYKVLAGESRDTAEPFSNPEAAVFQEAYVKIFPVTVHTVTVEGGTASPEEGAKGETITVSADVPSGYQFQEWEVESGNVELDDKKAAETTFLMPDEDVAIKAVFEKKSGGSSGSSPSRHDPKKEDSEETGTAAVQVQTGKTESAAGKMDTANGKITVTATIPAETLDRLVREKAAQYHVTTPAVSFGFGKETLKQLDSISKNGDIIVRAVQAANPTGELRPAYQISIVYRVNGTETPVILTGGTEILVRIPYVLGTGEQPGSVYAVTADAAQKAVWLAKSSYQEALSLVGFPITGAGVYGVGYHALGEGFTDIAGHWAMQDIIFTAGRGILAGTGKNTFSPDMALTWGMLPGELWKITGNTPDSPVSREQFAVLLKNYADRSGMKLPLIRKPVIFADNAEISVSAKEAVKAVQQAGVMPGRKNNRFAPKAPVTRAEAAAAIRRFIEASVDVQNVKGWTQNDSGEWSYIHPDGSMAVSTVIDGFQIGADGVRK